MTVTLNGTNGISFDVGSIPKQELIHYTDDIVNSGTTMTIRGNVTVTDSSVTHRGTYTQVVDSPKDSRIIKRMFESLDYGAYRNKMFSRYVITDGLETNTSLYWAQNSAGNRYATSIAGTLSWTAGAQGADFEPYTKLTAIMVNHGTGAQVVNNITHNSIAYTPVTVLDGAVYQPHKVSYKFLYPGYGALNLSNSISATYLKSSNNSANAQEMFVLPGQWNFVKNASIAYAVGSSTPISISGVQAGDLLIGHWGVGQQIANKSIGTWGGVDVNEMTARDIYWSTTVGTRIARAASDGTATFSTWYIGSPSTYFRLAGAVCVFRLTDL